jgi:hypothetical protein
MFVFENMRLPELTLYAYTMELSSLLAVLLDFLERLRFLKEFMVMNAYFLLSLLGSPLGGPRL